MAKERDREDKSVLREEHCAPSSVPQMLDRYRLRKFRELRFGGYHNMVLDGRKWVDIIYLLMYLCS